MPVPSRLGVPAGHRKAVALLARSDEDVWTQLLDAIESSDQLSPAHLEDRVAASVPTLGADGVSLVKAIVSMALSLARHDWSPSDMATSISASRDLELELDERDSLRLRLERLLSSSRLRLVSKASTVVSSHERKYHTSRIITDIRPIFPESASEKPIAAVVTHTMRLDYFGSSGNESIYFDVDRDALRQIEGEIRRAFEKEATLSSLMSEIGVRPYSEGDEA